MKATCAACGRTFEVSELYVQLVQSGKLESLCGYCDSSNGDDEGGEDYE